MSKDVAKDLISRFTAQNSYFLEKKLIQRMFSLEKAELQSFSNVFAINHGDDRAFFYHMKRSSKIIPVVVLRTACRAGVSKVNPQKTKLYSKIFLVFIRGTTSSHH